MGQGEDWHSFRTAVQQDLMRPKSALFYIPDLEQITDEVAAKVEAAARHQQSQVLKLLFYIMFSTKRGMHQEDLRPYEKKLPLKEPWCAKKHKIYAETKNLTRKEPWCTQKQNIYAHMKNVLPEEPCYAQSRRFMLI